MITKAKDFAKFHHIFQKRKFTGEDYFNHCENVAKIVSEFTDDENIISTAYLHDICEDCNVDFHEIRLEFNETVETMVRMLTNVSKKGGGNRKERKLKDKNHLKHASNDAKLIKLADVYDNCKDIVKHDRKFAKVYLNEKIELLEILEGSNTELFERVKNLLTEELKKLEDLENG